MKKLDFAQTIGLLANIGVIVGILFLAVEVGQNNELMADEAERVRAESRREIGRLLAENGDLATIVVKELNGEQLTEIEEFRLRNFWMRDIVGYQTSFQQLPREDRPPRNHGCVIP